MNSRMRQFVETVPKRKRSANGSEVDRIPGTSKIRTYCANASLYSKESTVEKMLKRAELCKDGSRDDQ